MYRQHCIPVLNGYGFQMATTSPLLEEWLEAYDGEHPLMDIGCAYGINTFEALHRMIPTIGLDMEVRQLEHIKQNVEDKYKHLITLIHGSLPSSIGVPDNSVSGILVAEVMHFLNGEDVEKTFAELHRKLVKGGKLFLTMASDKFLGYLDQKQEEMLHDNLARGIKWPAILPKEFYLSNMYAVVKSEETKDSLEQAKGFSFMQFFTKSQMVEEVRRNSFEIIRAQYGIHKGYPDVLQAVKGASLQIVALKK